MKKLKRASWSLESGQLAGSLALKKEQTGMQASLQVLKVDHQPYSTDTRLWPAAPVLHLVVLNVHLGTFSVFQSSV